MLEKTIFLEICKDLCRLDSCFKNSHAVKTKDIITLHLELTLIQEHTMKIINKSLEQDANWDKIEIILLKIIDYLRAKSKSQLNELLDLTMLARMIVTVITLKQSKTKISICKVKKIVEVLELLRHSNLLAANLLISLNSIKKEYPWVKRLISIKRTFFSENYGTVHKTLNNFYVQNFWRGLLNMILFNKQRKIQFELITGPIVNISSVINKIEIDKTYEFDKIIEVKSKMVVENKIETITEEEKKDQRKAIPIENVEDKLKNQEISFVPLNPTISRNKVNLVRVNDDNRNLGLLNRNSNLLSQQLLVPYHKPQEEFVTMPLLSSLLNCEVKGRIDYIHRLNAIYADQYFSNNILTNPLLIPVNIGLYYQYNLALPLTMTNNLNYNEQYKLINL